MTVLADHTTLRVGGPADGWVDADSTDLVVEAVREADDAGMPALILGEGSNIVVADAGFPGVVVAIGSTGVDVVHDADAVLVTVAAGERWESLAERSVAEGWAGIEALSGIPGLVGATPVQNVGAYGQDVAQVLTSLHALDRRSGEIVVLDRDACRFAYRASRFKVEAGRWVILDITLRLRADGSSPVAYPELAALLGVPVGATASPGAVRDGVLELRRRKGMVLDPEDHDTWSAGSFFTNPVLRDDSSVPPDCPRYPATDGVKVSAAWLIEHAGIGRGFGLGTGAAMSTKHALAITNRGGASAADILALARHVIARVRDDTGIDLDIEPVIVGDA